MRRLNLVLCLLLVTGRGRTADISFWKDFGPYPKTSSVEDTKAVTLGLRFSTSVSGLVTGVRFYKGPGNEGPHVGVLWSGAEKLAETIFVEEGASGWQQSMFGCPVRIKPDVQYVISYFAPKGRYSHDPNYAWQDLALAPLKVPASSPGVFAYGSEATFPASEFNSSNYWVDLLFRPNEEGRTDDEFEISGTVNGSTATLHLVGSEPASMSTDEHGSFRFSGLKEGVYFVTPVADGYRFEPSTSMVVVRCGSSSALTFTATEAPGYVQKRVSLSWTASVSPGVVGYNVYRKAQGEEMFTRLNESPIPATVFVDTNIEPERTYLYAATAVDAQGNESEHSNEAVAEVPSMTQTP